METVPDPSEEFGEIDFTKFLMKLLELEADTMTTLRYQAKILSRLESRDEQDVLDEMREMRADRLKEIHTDFAKSAGFSEEYIDKLRDL